MISLFDFAPRQGVLDKARKGTLLRECGELLKMHRVNLHHSIVYILHARVPIISFRDARFSECEWVRKGVRIGGK